MPIANGIWYRFKPISDLRLLISGLCSLPFALCSVALSLLALSNLVEAQQPGKVYRVGFLDFRSRSTTTDPRFVAFRQGLRELGYVEGQNIVIEYRSAKGKGELLPEATEELVRLKVDVIVMAGSPLVWNAAKKATRTIPIVMAGGTEDPVEAGVVASLAKPGGNITGLTNREVDLHGKRLELLKEAFPGISRVAIIWTLSQQKQGITEVKAAAQALGIQIQPVVVRMRTGSGLENLESAFSTISHESPDVLLLGSSALTLRHRARVVDFTAKRRLPTIYGSEIFVDEGGLMSYGGDATETYRRAATYVDKILKGKKPADLPIERGTKFELVINLKTAKQSGIIIPPNVLARADRVIR
ncbi:MAG TPA: ABC transporter substrate-binding protein [Candidatus Binatia bacterium]|nr:ABC transporter substrate-binding protein [Candidatus Binatia bacterium]